MRVREPQSAPAATIAPSPQADGWELSDAELEHVVGGLTRRLIEPPPHYDLGGGASTIDPTLRS